MTSLGYSVLLVNYRGSTGNGQDTIDSLPGKIGQNDVNDCQQAAEYCKEKYAYDMTSTTSLLVDRIFLQSFFQSPRSGTSTM